MREEVSFPWNLIRPIVTYCASLTCLCPVTHFSPSLIPSLSHLSHTHTLTVTLHEGALACVRAVAGPLKQCECQTMQKLREPRHDPLRSLLTLAQQLLQRHPTSRRSSSAQSQATSMQPTLLQATSSITESLSASAPRNRLEWGIFTLRFVETYSQFSRSLSHSFALALSVLDREERTWPEERKKGTADSPERFSINPHLLG